MTTKLSGCINIHGAKTSTKIPQAIKDAAAAGNTEVAAKALQDHISNLKRIKQQIIDEHEVNTNSFMKETISNSFAASYVNRAATDPTNELNHFKIKPTSIWKNLVQRFGKVSTAVSNLFATKDSVTDGEKAVLEHFIKAGGFGQKMSQTIDNIFLAKTKSSDPKVKSSFPYRYEDMIQYLPVREAGNPDFIHLDLALDQEHAKTNGILDPAVRGAIAATAYEWIATNGRKSMSQTEASLMRLLSLEKGESLPDNAWDLLSEAGTHGETLAKQLGKTILERISIAPGPKSDSLAKSRMEESLGFMAIAAMEAMGVVERQNLIADYTEESKGSKPSIGLEGLKENRELTYDQVFVTNDGSETGKKGFLTIPLIKLINVNLMEEIETNFSEGRAAFDKLFANEPQEFGVRWAAKKVKKFTIGRTKIEANMVQTANINNYNSIPYQKNSEAVSFLKSMWDLAESKGTQEEQDEIKEVFYKMLGAPSSENLLKVHEKGNKGVRRGIEQDFRDVLNYEKEHAKREANKESTEFYLSSDFMTQMRMIMRGDINPQNSKMHRSLFAPTKFKTTFKKDPKGTLDQAFLEAVALAFDIEAGKGITSDAKVQVATFMDIITNPDNDKHAAVTKAITAIQEYNTSGKMTEEVLKDITAGSVTIKNKVTGLKGLFEYARYAGLKPGEEFTTDIDAKIDGVTNGVIIGILQLLPDSARKNIRTVLATLAMGGVSTNFARADLNKLLTQNNLNDGYQRMAQEWAIEILKLKEMWNTKGKGKNPKLYAQSEALREILGEFQDKNGVINQTIRSLSKPRTTQILFGSGISNQVHLLTDESVLHDGIYKKVEEVIKRVRKADPKTNPDPKIKEDFTKLMSNVAMLTGDSSTFKLEKYFTGVSKEKTIENLQNFKLKDFHIKNLNDVVAATYGKAMSTAIETIYGPMIEARKPLNAAVQLAVTTYNTILKKKVNLLIEQHKTDKIANPEMITKEELDKILADIAHLIPKIKTPLHTKNDPSYLPLAEVGKNKSYTKEAKVKQNYKLDKLPLFQGYAEGIPYLADPGVAPVIKTIHMLESMVANRLMGLDIHMLNNHDGFSHGIGDSRKIADAANEIFGKVMTDYSMAKAFADMNTDLIAKGQIMKVTAQITSDLNSIAKQANRNKKEITDAVRQWHQYPHHGTGFMVESPINTSNKFFGNISTNTVTSNDAKVTDAKITLVQSFQVKGLNSSADGNVSTNETDYVPASQMVDNKNSVEVFDSLLTLDQNLEYASVQNSPSHVEYLRGVLNSIVSRVMGPVELFMDQHKINNETQGRYTIGSQETKRIWIQTQQRSTHPMAGMLGQGIRMSVAEVYAHELIHHITHTGLENFPDLQRQASALRELAFQQFSKSVANGGYGEHAYRVFLNDPTIDVMDKANAYEVAAAKSRWEYVFNSKRQADGSNVGLDEFISFGMTNENFKRELSKLQVSPEIIAARKSSFGKIFEKNIQQTIVNFFSMILEFIHTRFHQQKHSPQIDQELENLVRAISYADSKSKGVIWKHSMATEEAITAISLAIDEKIVGSVKKVVDSTKVGQIMNSLKELPKLDNMLSHQVRIALHWYTNQQQGLIPSIIVEMNATTDRLRPFHDMLRMRNHVLDVAKNEVTAVMQDRVNKSFKQPLTKSEKSAFTKALLKTDVSSLLDQNISSANIINYVKDPRKRIARIASILAEIKADPVLGSYVHFFQNAADDLGYFMIHSAAKDKRSVPLMNAHNIVVMSQTDNKEKLSDETFNRAVNLVDLLTTLSSLNYASSAHTREAAAVMERDWSGVEDVLNHHNNIKKEALNDLFYGNPAEMTKGYVKQILNSRIKFEQGTLADRQRYEDAGYYLQASPLLRDPQDPVQENIYFYKSSIGAVHDLQPGIVSFSQNIGRGTVSYDIQGQVAQNSAYNRMLRLLMTPTQIADYNNKIVQAATMQKIDNMFKVRQPLTPNEEAAEQGISHMIPKFNHKGTISEMRYMMNEHTKDTVLEQFSEVDSVLGAMASQIVDKTVTPKVNQDLIIALKDMADHKDYGYKALPEAFVEISPWSKEKRYRDIYHQLPPKARAQIPSIWNGENRMWVPQDMIDLAFGQRKYSVSETFGKDRKTRNMFENIFVQTLTLALGMENPFSKGVAPGSVNNNSSQGRAVRRSTAVFNTLAQLTKIGKSNIVVRNLGVIFGNYSSNMMLLKSMGVPLEKIMLHNKEAGLGILKYQEDKFELESWKQQKKVISLKQSVPQAQRDIQIRNIDRRIAVLENQIALNKVTALVNAGAIPNIVDDIDTGHVQSPHTYGVDALLDKAINVLPDSMQKAGRTLFMTTDTEGFKMMNNAVKLTDFTGRYVLYNHLISKGMDKDLAISEVMDKFIDFNIPTHRMISMLNDIGLVMFSKYKFRILKHIKNTVAEHPFTSIATYLIGKMLLGNNNIINSIPGFTQAIDQWAGNPLSLIPSTIGGIVTVDMVQVVGGVASDIVPTGE